MIFSKETSITNYWCRKSRQYLKIYLIPHFHVDALNFQWWNNPIYWYKVKFLGKVKCTWKKKISKMLSWETN